VYTPKHQQVLNWYVTKQREMMSGLVYHFIFREYLALLVLCPYCDERSQTETMLKTETVENSDHGGFYKVWIEVYE
jgi:hypothetical protein